MPKQILKIENFSGGINDNSDPRDIADNECVSLTDFSLNHRGMLKTLGGSTAHAADNVASSTISPGYGLFAFSSDFSDAGDGSGTAGSASATDYLVFADSSTDTEVNIWDGTAWHADVLNDLGAAWKPVFYYVDGALRVADANLANTTKWYGHIVRDRYTELSSSYQHTVHTTNISKWILDDANPRSATDLLTDTYKHYPQFTVQARASGSGGNENPESDHTATYEKWGRIYTGQKHAPHIRLYSALDAADGGAQFANGSGWDKVWNCAYTLIYDGVGLNGQESALHVIQTSGGDPIYNNDGTTNSNHPAGTLAQSNTGDDDLGNITQSTFSDRKAKIYVYIPSPADGAISADTAWNERITGFNIYLREHGTTDWYLQAEVDLNLGIKDLSTGSRSLKGWQQSAVSGDRDAVLYTVTDPLTSPSKLITYEANTGYGEEKHDTAAKFKTAVVANRRAWIGNVKFYHDDGTEKARPDAIVKSPVDKFDTFTERNLVEVTVSDGDEIVKLEEFSDRLFEFKKNKMTIINIAQSEGEFIESTHQHLGIAHPSAVCKTEFGIAWVNSRGAYMYDGQRINFLLEKENVNVISKSTWSSFITANSSIGYYPKTRQLFVLKSASSSGDGDCYVYDLVSRAWSFANSLFADNTLQTNFINDSNGDLVWGSGTTNVYKYDPAPDNKSAISYITKDFDFGAPAVRKKIYKVYVSYKGDGDSVTIQYGVNGETDTASDLLPFYRTNANGSSDGTNSDTTPLLDDDNKEHWINAELKPVTSINNIYSFQLHFGGTAGDDFEINDISIVYRLKSIK